MISKFDTAVYEFLTGYMSEQMTVLMKAVTSLGSGLAIASIALFIYFLFELHGGMVKYKEYNRIIIINLIFTYGLNELLKVIFHRIRPDILQMVDVTGYSFPSGHSMTSVSFYGLLLFIFLKNSGSSLHKTIAAVSLSLLVLLIGTSRVYLGVHYASDVIAGFAFGALWLACYINRSFRQE